MPTTIPIPTPAEAPTLSVEQTARIFRISRALAYERVAKGEIPAFRVGARWIVPTAEVRRMLGLDPDPQ